jgi:glycosyltransferase involved in cell wall biosynthesis
MPDILVFSALVPKWLGAKVILDLHDPMPELMMTIYGFGRDSRAVRLMSYFERWSIAFADVVLTVNRACAKIFASRSCSESKISVIMNSPDESIFKYTTPAVRVQKSSETGKRSPPFVIMYHGTLVERNGIDLAVEALAKIREVIPEAELRIYGPRTQFLDQIMLTVAQKGLEKAVHYNGSRQLEQLIEAITQCDVGVIPNKRSIFTELNTPTRIFEYLALGKPVVAPRAPGIQDYFSEDSLVLFELGNAEDIARKLIWVATHPQEAFEITNRGQAVYQEHSWSREKGNLLGTVGDLLRNGDRTK